MHQIVVPARKKMELWDDAKEEFITIPATKEQKLQLEHSLISLSKWESKWCKPYLATKQLTDEEAIDYIRCMTITPNVNPDIYYSISKENVDEVVKYIKADMTATTFSNRQKKPGRGEIVTSELIYYWMIAFNIPFECEKWHLNRLLTLIRICEIKNEPAKKMGRGELMSRNRALNNARKAKLHSHG